MTCHNHSWVLKTLTLVFSLAMGLLTITAANAASTVEQEIQQRIKPVGEVCIEGEDCGDIAAPVAAAPAGPRSGEDIYQTTCFGCHGTGAAGAPKLGDSAAWSPRIAQGMSTLVGHAINGFNGMPPRGTCGACSDDDIEATVQYMVENSQ